MKAEKHIELVTTSKECRVCYTCVRDCPAKAIRIAEGQALILADRCIACGNCVRVCSQHAKEVHSSIEDVLALLQSGTPVAACLAPSFPAEFSSYEYGRLVGLLRTIGFAYVHEVSFGADLVAARYRRLLETDSKARYIATTCPAIVGYVERYHPGLIPSLAPMVSPMVATARVIHAVHGPDTKVVFIGPCIAKKAEALHPALPREVDAALTFVELRRMFAERGLTSDQAAPSEFDPPHGSYGALFPLTRGLLQASSIEEDLLSAEVVAIEGHTAFVQAIEEFEDESLPVRLLEVLCCNGCIMGAGMTTQASLFVRRGRVSQYARRRVAALDKVKWWDHMETYSNLDLNRGFTSLDRRIPVPSFGDLAKIMARMNKLRPEDELNCGACGYDTCREHAIAIYKELAEPEMCLPFTIEKLRSTVQDLAVSNGRLAETQEALLHSEKLASMGQLAAGIAHELNNPLGVVLMYAHLLLEESQRRGDSGLNEDLNMISEQAERCKRIVSDLLHFARQNKVDLEPADVRELLANAVRLNPAPSNITLAIQHEIQDGHADLDCDQILQVLTNLMSNAYAAMPNGGQLTLRTRETDHEIVLIVSDTGTGVPKEFASKVFDPFFTTKEVGKGTGLGLAITYGIVKMHRGTIQLTTNTDPEQGPTGTTFTVTLPKSGVQAGVSE